MFYCKTGDLLIVRPLMAQQVVKFFEKFGETPYTVAIETTTHIRQKIQHGEIVLALENSVPPFYLSDMIRCLWKEKTIHIRRVDLQHLKKDVKDKNNKI